jgi:hypothetical protein
LALAALGRSEDALARTDAAITSGRGTGSKLLTAYALCCSTAALRDVLELDEARRRNEEAIDLYRSIPFESGAMQGEMDLLYADLTWDHLQRAAAVWPTLWSRLGNATGWERWLAPGRLSVANAEIAVRQERWEAAAGAALEAIDIARRIGRTKYDVSARIALGIAWVGSGRILDAVHQLRTAVAGADALVHPPTRWRAHAALGRALEAIGDERDAVAATDAAIDIATSYAATLAPEHSAAVLGSPEVQVLSRG